MKKIDVQELISTGSALKKASIVIAHYNIKEYNSNYEEKIKEAITDEEAKEIIDSFKSNKEILIYNQYRVLNMRIIQFYHNLERKVLKLSRDFYKKNIALFELIEENKKKKPFIRLSFKEIENIKTLIDEEITMNFLDVQNYYLAILVFAKKMKYKDATILELIHKCVIIEIEQMKKDTEKITQITGIGKKIGYKLDNKNQEMEKIANILYIDFGLNIKL